MACKSIGKRFAALALAAVTFVSAGAAFAEVPHSVSTSTPKYVFLFIGDGLGTAQRQVAEYYLQETSGDKSAVLHMNTMDVMGLNTTHSSDSLVTDSAAAGTALATGHKTQNGVIGKNADGEDVRTLVEALEEKGYATGLVSTTRLTHATPASFAAHNTSRNNENEIAVDMIDSGVDYFAGGGYRHFVPQNWEWGKSKRKDDRNLIQDLYNDNYRVFVTENDTESFRAFKPTMREKVFATFTYSHLPYEIDRAQNDATPSIAELTDKGIDVLEKYGRFFMMIEGGRIDHAGHANDAAGVVHDTLAFDKAVGEALAFYKEHPTQTLILVAGDHETGGLGLGYGLNYFMKLDELTDITASIEDKLAYSYSAGDSHQAFLARMEKVYGLDNLTADETARIEAALTMVDKGIEGDATTYGYNTRHPYAAVVAHIISERTNIEWTTYAHSGTIIPFTAVGKGADYLGGYKDNTEIAQTLAKIMHVSLSK